MKLKILQSIIRAWLTTKHSGFSLVEIVLSLAILALLTTALFGNFIYSQESAAVAGARSRATFLAEEGLEAVRNIRDAGYANLVDGNYGLASSSNQWVFSGSQDITGNYTRQIQITTPSANRKQIISQVTWQQTPQRTGTISLTTYLTNWIANAGGMGNWVLPTQQAVYDASGSQDGLKVFVAGNYAYLVRNDGTPDFLIIDISNLAAPALVGSLSLVGVPKDVWVLGNYAYVTNSDNNQELQVIDVSNPAIPTQVFSYNASGNNDGNGLFVSGNDLYLARSSGVGPVLVVMNLSNPAIPTLVGGYGAGATYNFYDVFVDNNHAFLASSNDTEEISIIDVSVPSTPTFVAGVDLSGKSDVLAITGFSGRIAIGRVSGDFVLLNVSSPNLPSIISTLGTTGSINDLSIGNSNNYVWIASSSGVSEFTVIDITTQASPTLLSILNLAGTLNGIFYDTSLDRAFGASGANSQELIIIQPS